MRMTNALLDINAKHFQRQIAAQERGIKIKRERQRANRLYKGTATESREVEGSTQRDRETGRETGEEISSLINGWTSLFVNSCLALEEF